MTAGAATAPAVDIVALHGFAASGRVWQPLAEGLRPQLRIEALDLPGHGGAPGLAPGLTLDGLTEACQASVTGPAVWLGWSLGGLVALHAARRFPHKVLAVVAVAISPRFVSAADWPNALDPEEFSSFASALKQDPAGTLDRFYALQTHSRLGASASRARELRALALGGGVPRPDVLVQTLDILGGADLRDEAAALSCPVMVVLGEDDLLVPSGVGEDMVRLNPNWRIEILPAAGHVPFLSHPTVFASLLESFVQSVNATRGAA